MTVIVLLQALPGLLSLFRIYDLNTSTTSNFGREVRAVPPYRHLWSDHGDTPLIGHVLATVNGFESWCLCMMCCWWIRMPFFKYVIVTSPCKSSQIISVTVVLPASYILHSFCVWPHAPPPPVSPGKKFSAKQILLVLWYGCFLKWWYPHFTPQNDHFQ